MKTIFSVKDDFDGKPTLASAEVRETNSCYIFSERLAGFGFVLRIDKTKVYLSAKAAIEAFIAKNKLGVQRAHQDIKFHEANIEAAQKLL